MKCPFCDQEVADDSVVCPSCGKPLGEKSGETGETVSGDLGQAEQPAEQKKPANKKKTGIIAAIIALVVVVGAAAAVLSPKKSGKDIVIDAFKSITVAGQTSPMEEVFGWNAMGEKLTKESSAVSLELQLLDSSDPTIQQLATGKIDMTALNDVANKKMFFSMGAGYADMDIANLEMYLDDKQLVVAVPELSNKAFSLNYADDLEGQIANSPYLGQFVSESGVDITGLNQYLAKCNEVASTGEQLFNLPELWKRYKEGSKAIDDLKAAMTVEKADKKDFTIDGQSQSCKGYNVTITKDALIQFLTTSKEFFLQDETLKKDFVEYMSLVNELQGTMTALSGQMEDKTPEQLQEETWTAVEEQFNVLLEQLKESMGDVTLAVYVRKDGKMASFDYSTNAAIEEEEIRLYGTVSFAGGYSMLSNVNGTLNMENAEGESIKIELDKTGNYEAGKSMDGTFTATIDLTGIEDSVYSMVSSADYTVEDGAYHLSADFQGDGKSALKLTSSGMVQNLKKGESLEIMMDSLKIELGEAIGLSDFVDLSGSYKAGPLDQTVEVPEGEILDILAASEAQWTEVATEVMGNVYSLMMNFYQ